MYDDFVNAVEAELAHREAQLEELARSASAIADGPIAMTPELEAQLETLERLPGFAPEDFNVPSYAIPA
jgi:hypothetical protein